jgi:predicted  nucleic acid-binding Zn-ribbon protein
MKHIFSILLLPAFLSAQEHIRIEEMQYDGFSETQVPVYKVEVDMVAKKALMDHWQKFLKSDAQGDVNRTDNDLNTKNFPFKAISVQSVNVYMHFEDMEDGTRSYIAFEDSVNGFIAISNPDYGIAIKKKIYEETHEVYVVSVQERIKNEKSHLADLESEYNKLIKEKDKLNKKILDAEQQIQKTNNDIEINEGVLSELTTEVSDKRSTLNSMSASAPEEARKQAEKNLSGAEKNREKMSKRIDKDRESVYDLETDIRKYKYEIEKLEPQIELAKRKVDDQRTLIAGQEEDLYHKQRGH